MSRSDVRYFGQEQRLIIPARNCVLGNFVVHLGNFVVNLCNFLYRIFDIGMYYAISQESAIVYKQGYTSDNNGPIFSLTMVMEIIG